MKKVLILAVLAFIAAAGFFARAANAQPNADALVLDHKVMELSEKYIALLNSMFVEEGIRTGGFGYHHTLEPRDKQSEAIKKQTMLAMQDSLNKIDYKKLSTNRYVEYFMLKGMVNRKVFEIDVMNRLENNPLWYLEPVEGAYYTITQNYKPAGERYTDAIKRLRAFPEVIAEAKKNIKNPPDLVLRLSLDRVHRAYTNIQALTDALNQLAPDHVSKDQAKAVTDIVKAALKDYFDFLREKLNNKEYVDFRLGAANYDRYLNDVFFIEASAANLRKNAEKELQASGKTLLSALTPLIDQAFTKEERAARTDAKGLINLTAQDYYTVAARLTKHPKYEDTLNAYLIAYNQANSVFKGREVFPPGRLKVGIIIAPPFFTRKFTDAVYLSPFPMAAKQTADFLVALPAAEDAAAIKAVMPKLFTHSKIKISALRNLALGRNLMYGFNDDFVSPIKKIADDPSFTEGWVRFSFDTAREKGLPLSDEDKLNLAWDNYKAAAFALADLKMHSGELNYTQALEEIIAYGIDKDEAAYVLDGIALNPGRAVTYLVGSQEMARLRAKYQKRQGKEFNLEDFNNKLLLIGRAPVISWDKAMETAYSKRENDTLYRAISF